MTFFSRSCVFLKYSLMGVVCASVLTLGGCMGGGPNQSAGGLLGGILGGIGGSFIGGGTGRVAATIAGSMLGSSVGSAVGQSMDRTDKLYAMRARERALESSRTGRSITWNNPDTGYRGRITPTKTFYNHGRVCRAYKEIIIIGKKVMDGYRVACRGPDGVWR